MTLAGVLALGGGVAAANSPPKVTATITPTVKCVLPAGQGEATGPQEITVTFSPSEVAPGGKVKASVTLGDSPATSGFDLPDVPTTPSVDFRLGGGASGTVTARGPEIPLDIVKDQPIRIPPYEGEFLLPTNAAGEVTFTPTKLLTQTKVFGQTFTTVCEVVSGGGVIGSVTAKGEGGPDATLTAPTGEVRPNTDVTLGGAGWTPGATPVPSLCGTDGGGCDPTKFTANSLVIGSDGALTGTAHLAEAGAVANGSYLVKVGDGTKEATAPLTVKAVAAGERQLNLSVPQAPLGSVITVTGRGYGPDQWINVVGLDAYGATLDDTAAYGKSAPDGTFSIEFTVSSDAIAFIQADEGNDPDTIEKLPFRVTPPDPGGGENQATQNLGVTVGNGNLTMVQAGSSVSFGTVGLTGRPQTVGGDLNKVTVLDARGNNTGWSLTGTLTDFTGGAGGAVIDAGAVSWRPTCAAGTGSVGSPTPGPLAALGSTPAALCSLGGDGARSVTGGSFDAGAGLTLSVPAVVSAGTYQAVLTLSLS
ncbi:WxL domain-containing protein [Streptomyces sp. BI20]|uniref:WxL domain-containing protein n=1 Tax=Streptomyces sp. BI20 TaxID=3403460 RepID=UPI003C71B9E8